jgi:hypothetical protein
MGYSRNGKKAELLEGEGEKEEPIKSGKSEGPGV